MMRAFAHRTRRAVALLAAVVALAAVTATPAAAAPVSIYLCATTGSVDLPGMADVPIWGFARTDTTLVGDTTDTSTTISNLSSTAGLAPGMTVVGVGVQSGSTIVSVDNATDITISLSATATGTGVSLTFVAVCGPGLATLPGPVLDVNDGDVVTINLTNALPADPPGPEVDHVVSFEIPGTVFDPAASDEQAAVGETATVTFTATDPGTYLYQSGGDAGRQEAMGLFGALIVRPSTAGQAYDNASTAFDGEVTLVLSAIDPAFNAAPDTFDVYDHTATYWLINGTAYPDTPAITAADAGERLLIRYVNAGFDNTTMLLLGMHQQVLARDAILLNNPYLASAETFPAGGTSDAIATIPSTAAPSVNGFPLYNRQVHLTNGSPSSAGVDGGMVTFIVPTP